MSRLLKRMTALVLGAAIAVSAVLQPPARAQGRLSIVRDAEIEALLSDYAAPIFRVAGLASQNIEIILVNDRAFNAFVDGRRIFINTGALQTAETPGEIIGVIAHEAGHIAGGHQQRLREQIARAQIFGVVGSLLGVGAIAAGSLSGSQGAASTGMGMATASGGLAQLGLLKYRRSEEMNADQAAVRYLDATGQSAAGMLATFRRFSQGLALAGVQVNPYEVSHPLPRERIAMMEQLARSSPHFDASAPSGLQERHDLMRAKIAAYTGGPGAVQRVFRDAPGSLAARYGNAISAHLSGNATAALQQIEALIAERPNNAYFREIKGEILLAAGRPNEAADAYGAAIDQASDPSLLRAQRGFALSRTGDPATLDRAVADLRAAISADPTNLNAYRQLAQVYGQQGDIGNAELAMAEGHFHAGDRRQALIFAARAQQKLQPGTPSWNRANDIVTLGR